MKIYDNTKYAFIVAVIRSSESKMLNVGEIERMLGAKDAQEAYRVLNDLDYAKFLGDVERVEDFQIVINAGLIETKEMLLKNAPYPELLDLLWLRYDFANLKAFIKMKVQAKDFDEVKAMFLPYGKYSLEELKKFFIAEVGFNLQTKKKKTLLDKKIEEAIQEALKIYTETQNPILIDAVVDKIYYQYLLKILPEIRNRFVNEYYHLEIDLKNLRMYLRVIALEQMELFTQLYLEGGSLAREKFTGNLEEFSKNLKGTIYFDLVKKAIENFVETKSFFEFEKETDAMLLDYMLKARYLTFGIEPLFAFFWIKENNAQIIRMIMVNKLNGIPSSEIRKKLRKLYQ